MIVYVAWERKPDICGKIITKCHKQIGMWVLIFESATLLSHQKTVSKPYLPSSCRPATKKEFSSRLHYKVNWGNVVNVNPVSPSDKPPIGCQNWDRSKMSTWVSQMNWVPISHCFAGYMLQMPHHPFQADSPPVDGNAQSHDLQQWAFQRRTVHFWHRKALHFAKEPGSLDGKTATSNGRGTSNRKIFSWVSENGVCP